MKAFLLTAGLGTRLRPLTNDLPKCMLPVGGKPLLEIWLELLGKHGVKDVLVNTHWYAEKVVNFLEGEKVRREEGEKEQRTEVRDQRSGKTRGQPSTQSYAVPRRSEVGGRKDRDQKLEVRSQKERRLEDKTNEKWPGVRLFYEKELLGSAGTVLVNRDWVDDGQPFFILYGDNLTNVDLRRMYEFHLGHGLPFTLGVFRAERPEACGIAEVDKEGVVVAFMEKPEEPKSDLAAAGIYVADQRIFDFFPEGAEGMRPLDLGFHVIPKLVGHMKAYFIEEFLMDIGTADSYRKAQDIYPQITQITRIK